MTMEEIWEILTRPTYLIIYIAVIVVIMALIIIFVMVNEHRFNRTAHEMKAASDRAEEKRAEEARKPEHASRFSMLKQYDAAPVRPVREVPSAQLSLRELCEAGYIVKQERFDERKNGGQTSNLYILAAVSQSEPDADTSSESTGYPQDAPNPESVLSWEPCAHMFTDSFPDGMERVLVPFASAASSVWPGGEVIFIPP